MLAALLFACVKQQEEAPVFGELEIQFDNVVGSGADKRQLCLAEAGSADYDYRNGLEQPFNVTLLRYYISGVKLEGPNGEYYEDEMTASAGRSKGYYLVDEADPASQYITLKNVPQGAYDKLSFTVGVDAAGLMEDAVGGVLDPLESKMFWSWELGYIALKFEGQSPESPGQALGESIHADNPAGFVFHIGGWKDDPPSRNNNRVVHLVFDGEALVGKHRGGHGHGHGHGHGDAPHIHLEFNVAKIFQGARPVDFRVDNAIVDPATGAFLADNIAAAFRYDHMHQ
jgi:hypothetical protein